MSALLPVERPTGLIPGCHLAQVTDLNDPDNRNRVKVRLLALDGEGRAEIWARVALPFAGDNRGAFFIPDVGDEVLVSFVAGDPRFPIVLGGLWNGSAAPPAAISGGQNRLKVIRSKNGVQLTLDDQQGREQFIVETPGGQKVTLKDGPGAVTIEDSNGNSVKLESAGITVTASAKVTVNASQVSVSAASVQVDAAMSSFSGIVRCDVLQATTVIASTYTPGAGNVW
jgi:uncharacterized protein involved in type VI secretion and phage assembly